MGSPINRTIVWAIAWVVSGALAFLIGHTTKTLFAATGLKDPVAPTKSHTETQRIDHDPTSKTASDAQDDAPTPDFSESLLFSEQVVHLSPDQLATEYERLIQAEDPHYLKLNFVIHEWARHNPRAVLEAILNPEHAAQINTTSTALMAVWAKVDPLQAYEAYRKHLAHQRVFGAAEFAFYGLASMDPERALREIRAYDDDYLNQHANRLEGIREALVRHYALPRALEIIDSASDDPGNRSIRDGVIRPWILSDFDYTVETLWQIDQQKDGGSTGIGDNTKSVVYAGLSYDPERTLAWTSRKDQIEGTNSLTRHALNYWASSMRHPEDVRAWIEARPSAEERERYRDIVEWEETQ